MTDGTPGTWVRIGLNPLTPTRIADTRPDQGPPTNPLNVYDTGPLGPGQIRTVTVAGPIGPAGGQQTVVPLRASAAVFNLAVTGTTAAGYLTVWPADQPRPRAASINWTPGQTISNGMTVKLGAIGTANAGKINLYNSAGTTHVILDLTGFYS